MTEIVIDNGVSESDMTVLDMTRFSRLRSLIVGNHCFSYVTTVNITGLTELRTVVIGNYSFTKEKSSWGYDSERRFYLKNCLSLIELSIGYRSFSDYGVIEIENVDALETIRMNAENWGSFSFYSASLELKSIVIHSE